MPNILKSIDKVVDKITGALGVSDAEADSGKSLFEGYCTLDKQISSDKSEQFTLFNMRENYQINCYLVPNFLLDDSRFSLSSCVHLDWQSDVHSLSIEDHLFNFGIRGTLVVKDSFGNLSYLLEQFINYELVINILLKLTDTGIVRFDPYILNIVSVEEMVTVEEHTKFLLIHFEDLITSEAKKHSFGTLLKYVNDLKQSKSFPEIFSKIYSYLQGIINDSLKKKFKYDKEIKFNNYLPSDESSIIEFIIDDMMPNHTIYDFIQALSAEACVEINPDDKLIADFEMPGKMMVPIFFKEEYSDMQNYYYTAYNEKADDLKNSPGGEGAFIRRPFTLRNFFMPFQDGFSENQSIVFESFTTSQNNTVTSENIIAINGQNPLPVKNIQALTSNADMTNKRWKNLAFLSCNTNGGSNRLVFFNWIYEFFNQVFLKGKLGQKGVKLSNVAPNFYMSAQFDDNLRNDQDFAEKNANVILLRNEKSDPIKEIIMEMGKSVASLVFLNNMYSFEVEGSLFRRPNEIINLYTPQTIDALNNQTIRTDFAKSNNVILYATDVVHTFSGNTFTDKVICNRVYEKTEVT